MTRSAAWAAPTISLAVAAPVMAASGCHPTVCVLDWSLVKPGTNQLGRTIPTSGASGVTVVITAVGDTGADGNGVVTSAKTGGVTPALRLYEPNDVKNAKETVTIQFSEPVSNVSLSLMDIDSRISDDELEYQDTVVIHTPGWSGSKHSNISAASTGSDTKPYRAKTRNSPVTGAEDLSNVDLTWAGPLTSVSFTYAQDGTVHGTPFIGLSNITFTVCR